MQRLHGMWPLHPVMPLFLPPQVTPKDLHEALTLLISQPRFQGMVPQPYPLFDPATRQQGWLLGSPCFA